MYQWSEASGMQGVSVSRLLADSEFPVLVTPSSAIPDPIAWARLNRDAVDQLIYRHGALLFRGFALNGAADFQSFVDALCPASWADYREASTPRSNVLGHVFTSTEYPADFRIYVHNENSHVTSWPMYLFFYCRIPADQGGETPIANCRGVYQRLPTSVRERLEKTGWLYRRNFHDGSSFTWQKTFGTDRKKDVDDYCAANYMVRQWKGDSLIVRYRRWAALEHPRSGEMVWFNHGTFFNPHVLEPSMKSSVLALGEDRMPYNTYYGDGSPLEEETIRILDAAYAAETVSFPWRAKDLLMLDNMRFAHGRSSFKGKREVLVAMKQKTSCTEVARPDQFAPPR
jgi:hypothetical protein